MQARVGWRCWEGTAPRAPIVGVLGWKEGDPKESTVGVRGHCEVLAESLELTRQWEAGRLCGKERGSHGERGLGQWGRSGSGGWGPGATLATATSLLPVSVCK